MLVAALAFYEEVSGNFAGVVAWQLVHVHSIRQRADYHAPYQSLDCEGAR